MKLFLCCAFAWLLIGVGRVSATNCHFSVVNQSASAWSFDGTPNPTLNLFRGFRYQFNINSSSIHPFLIKSVQGTGSGNAYNDGVTGNGTFSGQITFSVPTNAPATLFYNCQNHSGMTGTINLFNPPDPSALQFKLVESGKVEIVSQGTDKLGVEVEALTDIINGTWIPVPVTDLQFSGGTNVLKLVQTTNLVFIMRVKQPCY